jgi:hypothetical protein
MDNLAFYRQKYYKELKEEHCIHSMDVLSLPVRNNFCKTILILTTTRGNPNIDKQYAWCDYDYYKDNFKDIFELRVVLEDKIKQLNIMDTIVSNKTSVNEEGLVENKIEIIDE